MSTVRADLPAGTVTFLFTDIEGSTSLLHELGPVGYAAALEEHRRLLRAAVSSHGGVEVDTQGDAFFLVFPTAGAAMAAAEHAQRVLAEGPVRVRMGMHTGTPALTAEGYVGIDVHLGARIAAVGHGGQVLLSAATRSLVDEPVTELGEHRLKDFVQPVAIYQLGDSQFPPLKSISNTNLPRPASSFVGREEETAEVAALLRNGTRLVTLTGPGGTGKTRLGIEAAAQLVGQLPAGVFWVGLAAVREPALVTETIGQVLGAKSSLSEHIGDREMLLLLDNFENVIEAADDVSQLLEACPRLRLLVTSRELLRVRGEVQFSVPPLSGPEATELFCTRSGMEPNGQVRELCQRLDNLPLAIELAAARARVLSVTQILERLGQRLDLFRGGRDLDARQHTLRATIEWSHELLNEQEQRQFARLAVFAGGCTLEDAEAVVDADVDVLQSLVDKSLVRRTGSRFWMLETIREYALERFRASQEVDEWQQRYVQHFLTLAQEAEPWTGEFHTDARWLDRLAEEQDNLRGALEIVQVSGDGATQLQFVNALAGFWGQRGFLAEGWRHVERALRAAPEQTLSRARALNAAADLGGLAQGDSDAVKHWAEQALALHRQLGNDAGAAESLFLLGHAAADQGEFRRAQAYAEESRTLFELVGDSNQATAAVWLLGWAHVGLGDVATARCYYGDALQAARVAGLKDLQSLSLYSLSRLLVTENRPLDALPLVVEAYDLARADRNRWRLALTGCRLAWVLTCLGDAAAAVRVFSSATALLEEMGGKAEHRAEEDEEILARTRSDLDEERFAAEWAAGQQLPLEQAMDALLASMPPSQPNA